METDRIAAFARSVRGAPAVCLIVMQLLNRRTGHKELIRLTGYSDKPIAAALDLLELYGLAYSDSRFNGWQLTDKGRQLPLFGEQAQIESESFRLDSSSSSSSFKDSHDSIDSKQLLLQQNESELFRLEPPEPDIAPHPDHTRLTDLLVAQTACPRPKAAKAVAKALAAGVPPLTVEYRIMAWLGYCLSKNGKNLNPAHFVASRLQEPCTPAGFKIASLQDGYPELYEALADLERRLDEWLCSEEEKK